jgi:tetratricopeptide (TPR) repeat protein
VPDEADIEKAAKAALRHLAEQRATWLLAYDNVSSPDEISDLLPSGGARVLITSRFSDWSELAEEVKLDVLSLEEAIALLHSRTGRNDVPGAKTLAEAVGRLPLALDHAAAYCKRTQMRFADYARKASSLMEAVPRGAGYPRSVAATFNLAITEAVARCPAAEALMSYLAQCAPERIPMTLVEGAVDDEDERREALAALAEASLVKHDPFEDGTPAVTMHRLVQAVAQARSQRNGSAENALERLIARLVAIYPDRDYGPQTAIPVLTLTPHLLRLHEMGADSALESREWAARLNVAGAHLILHNAYTQAERLLNRGLAIREKALGTEHPDVATSLESIAALRHRQGDRAESRKLLERALTIQGQALDADHLDIAITLESAAKAHSAQGDFVEARKLLERAFTIREKAPQDMDTGWSLVTFADILRDEGDLSGERIILERALSTWEHVIEKEAPPELLGEAPAAEHFHWLALAYSRDLTLVTRALLFEGRALAIREKALGPEHPSTNRTRCHLSRLLLTSGQPTEALALGEKALNSHANALGRDHASTKDSARVTADALDALGRAEEAKALREKYGVTEAEKPKPS